MKIKRSEYEEARERMPEPSSSEFKRGHMIRFRLPMPPICDFTKEPEISFEHRDGFFQKKLVRQDGVTFWAWVAEGRIFY